MSNGQLYTVESKDEIRRLGKGDVPYVAYRIYATTKKGTYFSVEVPEDDLDKAPEILEAKAKKLDSI